MSEIFYKDNIVLLPVFLGIYTSLNTEEIFSELESPLRIAKFKDYNSSKSLCFNSKKLTSTLINYNEKYKLL